MNECDYLIYISTGLFALNVFQAFFWSWQNQKLINKLMCRDLAEYKYVTEGPKETPAKSFEEYEEEHEQKEILAELNGMLPR